jgi:hypothetical protein
VPRNFEIEIKTIFEEFLSMINHEYDVVGKYEKIFGGVGAFVGSASVTAIFSLAGQAMFTPLAGLGVAAGLLVTGYALFGRKEKKYDPLLWSIPAMVAGIGTTNRLLHLKAHISAPQFLYFMSAVIAGTLVGEDLGRRFGRWLDRPRAPGLQP